MNSQHCSHSYLLRHLPLITVWCLLTILFIGVNRPGHAQAAPALFQTLPRQFVNEEGTALVRVPLRILCYQESNGRFALTHDLRDVTTDQGQLAHQLPIDCSHLLALQEIYQQPAGKPGRDAAYTVYHPSWSGDNAVPAPANSNIVVPSDRHLVLFDVAVALEWELDPGQHYLQELAEGLQLASDYLYDVTDGQMAFGAWQITTGGQGWESADIRIRAANDYRPSAQVGGIVASATPYTSANGRSTIYVPGAIVLGRYWNGTRAADPIAGAWNRPAAYRTLVHEWLHYALFLYDEYQAVAAEGRTESYCTCVDLPQVGQNPAACGQLAADLAASVMGYHYTASELWLGGAEPSCQASEQFYVHGGSDWATLARWGAIQGLQQDWIHQPTSLLAGPILGHLTAMAGQSPTLAADQRLFLPWLARQGGNSGLRSLPAPGVQSAAVQSTSAVTVHLSLNASLTLTDLLAIQVQIYTWEPATATHPARVLYQGTTTGRRQAPDQLGEATLVGIKAGTQVAVHVIHPGATNYLYYGALDPTVSQQNLRAVAAPTTLDLAVAPRFDGTRINAYNLTLWSGIPLSTPPVVQLCTPEITTGCAQNNGWRQPMIDSGAALTWTTTLTALPGQPFPELGILQVETSSGALFRWYETLGGVGPSHLRGHAPRRDGLVTVDGAAGFPAGPNLVFMMPTANSAALRAALPPGVSGAMGSPFEVQVLLANTGNNPVTASSLVTEGTPVALPVLLSMFYDKATADQFNLKPNQSQLLQYQAGTKQWQLVALSGRSETLSWLATQPLSSTGVMAVARMTSPDFGLKPEIYARAGKPPNPSPIRVQLVMPAASTILTTSAFVRSDLPVAIQEVRQIQCNLGSCSYEPATHQVLWQGSITPNALLIFSFELYLDDTIPPGHLPKALTLVATAFDGAREHALSVDVPLRGPQPEKLRSPSD